MKQFPEMAQNSDLAYNSDEFSEPAFKPEIDRGLEKNCILNILGNPKHIVCNTPLQLYLEEIIPQ